VRAAVRGGRGDQHTRAQLAADHAACRRRSVAAPADVWAAVAGLADDQVGLPADPAGPRWPLVAGLAARPLVGRRGDRPMLAAAAAHPSGRGVAAGAQRLAVLVAGGDRAEGAALAAGLERRRVAATAAGTDRPALGVAERHDRGLPAAGAGLQAAAAQAPVADPAAGHRQAQLPAGGIAPRATGPRHAGDPGRVQLPQQPHQRERACRRPAGERVGMAGQPGGQLLAFAHAGRDPPGQATQELDVDRAESGGDGLQDGVVGAGAPAGRARPRGAGLAVGVDRAVPHLGWGLAAGTDQPSRAGVAKPPLAPAGRADREPHAPCADVDERTGQLEQPPAAGLPAGKARPGAKAAFQLHQRPRRRRDRTHYPGKHPSAQLGLQPVQDGDDPGQPLPVTLLLPGTVASACGRQLGVGGSGAG
jgi:hypothetical protein